MTRLAIVMNADRDWALQQKPAWARMYDDDQDYGEIVDDGGWFYGDQDQRRNEPSWFSFLIGEVERFEKFYALELKTEAEWSVLWRKSWWPKRREDWKYAMGKKHGSPHPFFKRGSAEFERALRLATPQERLIWERFGVAQFVPDDKRLAKIIGKPPVLTERSKAMAGGE